MGKVSKKNTAIFEKVRKAFPRTQIRDRLLKFITDEKKVNENLELFQLFMALKISHEDFDATRFSPGPEIDLVWKTFLLYPADYLTFCMDVADDRVIDYNIKNAESERLDRVFRTRAAFLDFGMYYNPEPELTGIETEKQRSSLFDVETDLIWLQLEYFTGERTLLKDISIDMSVRELKRLYEPSSDIMVHNMRFVFSGTYMDNEVALREYEIQSGSIIHVFRSR